MWAILFLCLGAVAAQGSSGNQPWKQNTQYEYAVEGRTLTALHQVSNQYAGLMIRATVQLRTRTDDIVSMQVKSAEYSDIHANLSQGWSSPIPESQLHFQQIPLSKTAVELKYRKGLIRAMTVSKGMPIWELNLMKSFVNQLQVDTQAENLLKSRINSLPTQDNINAVYKTMEESMGGMCETLYDLAPLPKAVLMNKPELAPFVHLQPNGQIIDIVKTRNFSNCDVPTEYHFGITGLTDWMPSSNQMGEFMARTSMSRVIISGDLNRYTIQSSITTSKVITSPLLFNDQNGMVVSSINMTLVNIKSASGSFQSPPNPQTVPHLVYEYNPASADENEQRSMKQRKQKKFEKYNIWNARKSLSGDSSTSSHKGSNGKRSARSAEYENNSSSYNENKRATLDRSQENSPDAMKLSHIDWLKKFMPDIYFKVMQKSNNTAALVRDPQLPTSSESSSSSFSDDNKNSFTAIHMSHEEWLKKFMPDIYNMVMNAKNISRTPSLFTPSAFFSSSESSSSSADSYSSTNSNVGDFSLSWESSEEKTWHPTMNEAPRAPFLPMFIGNKGNSIQSAKEIQIKSSVNKLATDIAHDIQNPSSIPGQMTLAKFSILTQILQTMNVKQMSQAANEMFFSQSQASSSSSNDAEKYHAWVAFRDAMAEAGTGPALITLKEMIESKKVQGEEAAQLVSVLPNSARFPNSEYMNTFFDLVTSSQVKEQHLVNTSAIISFSELARKAFVSKSSAYKRFPVNVYGPVMSKKEQPVIQKYIPYFARGLKEAVKNADSNKIRTMVTALGNIAHPRILSVFEPYLEGKEPATHFQRLTMVVALNRMAKVFPNAARPVLFRIYQNTGEASEIRVAAVFQIMKTNPPAQMLQRMAQFTNEDQNMQVVSAVQSAIRSAASLSSPSDHELMVNAQAAVHMLSSMELPAQLSKKKVHSYWANQLNLAYKQAISYIGSDDSFMPSNLFYSLRRNLGGFNRQTIGFSAMSSSVDAMANFIMDQFTAGFSSNQQSRNFNNWMGKTTTARPWSTTTNQNTISEGFPSTTEEINNILNNQPREQEQIEASLYMTTLLGKRYFALDNHTIEQLPQMVMKAAAALRSGEHYNYSKITDKMSMTVAFPMDMGFPFVFTLKTPTLMMLAGSAQVQSEPDLASGTLTPPKAFNMSADLRLVYSSRTQSQMGFVAPFNKQHYISGVSKNIQVNVPVRTKIDFDIMNRKMSAKVEPLDESIKQNVMEYSTIPYTTKRNILQLVQNPQREMQPDGINKRVVHVRSANQIHKTIGQESTGLAFDFDYHSEQKFIDFAALYNEARKHNPLSAMIYAWAEDSTNFNNITLAFNPNKSSAKYAKFTATYLDDSDDTQDSSRDGGSRGSDGSQTETASASVSMAQATSSVSDSHARQQQFLANVGAGIQDKSAMVLDWSAEFLGQSKASFVATFAAATSYTSPKARYLFFADKSPAKSDSINKQSQICVAAETVMPNVPLMNFVKALNADPTSSMSAEMAFGEKCSQSSSKISMKGKMKQSGERHQMMEQMPLAQLCLKQIQEGNTVLSACRNVTMHANCMDQYKLSVQFDKISDFWKNMTYKAYSVMRYAGYQYVTEDLISANNPNNVVDMEANFAPDLTSLNITVNAPILSAQFTNMVVDRTIQPLIVVNPEYSAIQRAAEYAFQGQHFPTCVLDGNQAETFDNRSYPLNLGQCWHVMMHYTPKQNRDGSASNNIVDYIQNIAVLVRDSPSKSSKEVKIMMGENMIHLEPSKVTVNGEPWKVQQGHLSQAEDKRGLTFLQMYQMPSGAMRLFTPQQNMEFQYDGSSIKIRAPNSYRTKVRGLCGTFNSEPFDDFTTPADCVMQNPFEFAAMYAIDDHSCSGPSKALKPQAVQSPCFRNSVNYGNVVTDREASIDLTGRKQAKRMREIYSSCMQKRMVFKEKEGKVCFSLKPQVQCNEGCKPQRYTNVEVDVFCTEPTSATQHWQDMVQQGKIPDFSQKRATQVFSMEIPESCLPKYF